MWTWTIEIDSSTGTMSEHLFEDYTLLGKPPQAAEKQKYVLIEMI